MALVKLSGLASDIRGKIGGTIFQGTQGGLCIKSNTTPINKNSLSQNLTKNITNICQQEWLELTNAQRILWKQFVSYAKIPQKNFSGLYINGQQCFLKLNHYRLQYGHSILTVPEYIKWELKSVDIDLHGTGTALYLTFDRMMINFHEFIILFISYPVNDTINNPGSRLKLLIFPTPTDVVVDITSEYENLFGIIPKVGDNLFIKYSSADLFSGLILPFILKKETL